MGKQSGGAEQTVNEYRMSLHSGWCVRADALTAIWIGEKQAWSGYVDGSRAVYVNAPNLFGGQKKEGGVSGHAYWLRGDDNQVMPSGLAGRRNLTSEQHPAYRGVSTIYFVGSLEPGSGFWWGNTPYMQSIWATFERAPKGLAPQYAMIGNRVTAAFSGYSVTIDGITATLTDGVLATVNGHGVIFSFAPSTQVKTYTVDGNTIVFARDSDDRPTVTVNGNTVTNPPSNIVIDGITINGTTFSFGSDGRDANPAHIIYECLTNKTWGMGGNDTIIDRENFEAVAKTLYHEGFGLSLAWKRESSIESFITEIIDHIQAALYVDPDTGKITLKLFRDDYDATTLPFLTPDNAELDNYQRKLWGETVNEISVSWTNPVNEQEETITFQDLGNITVQGGVVSDSRNYYGVRNAALAMRLAQRDSRQSAAPLASVEAKVDRTSWNLKPGSRIRLSWPEYEIVNLVMRVTNIDYGKVGSPGITVSLLEDIFSLEDAMYNQPPETGWVNPASDPTPLNYARIITAPGYFSSRRLSAADAAILEYPEVLVSVLSGTTNRDAVFYELVGQTSLPNGDIVAEEIGTRPILGTALLPVALPEEATSTVASFGTVIGGTIPTAAGFLFIGNVGETVQEIALIKSVGESGWVLQRGCLDTVPRAWPAGTVVWFYDIRVDFFDLDIRSAGEGANYKLLTTTSKGRLDINDAPITGAVLTGRPHLPNRPADVRVAGVQFGPVDLAATTPSSVTVTWATRNRTMEDATVLAWTDASVIPETGQTTRIRLIAQDGTVLVDHTGITGTSYTLPSSDWGLAYEADLHVTSQRDGLESLQSVVRRVRIRAPGYGDGYGDSYGGPGSGYTPPPVTDPPPPADPPYDPGETFPPPWQRPGLEVAG